jgi:hypothetical protein
MIRGTSASVSANAFCVNLSSENKHHAHQRRRHDRNLHYGQRPPLQQAGNADSCSAVGMAFEVVAVDVIEDWTGDAAC